MSWKNWPNQLKVGIMLGAIVLILNLLAISYSTIFSSIPRVFRVVPLRIVNFPFFYFFKLLNFEGIGLTFFILIVALNILFWFIIGTLIGRVYNKIRRKRK